MSATKQNAYNGSQPGSSAFDSNSVPPANSNVKNVDKTTGTDKSLDLPTDTETEDRGWDLPEALEEQLIAELESSYAEDEEVPEDVYIDGEAKDYVEIFGENDKSFYALSGVELHNELAEQMKSGSQVFISGTSFEQKQGARESATAYTEDGKALRGEILTNVNVENFDHALDNGVNWVDKAYIYARTEEGVDYVLPVVVAEEGGHYKFIASYEKGWGTPLSEQAHIVYADDDFKLLDDSVMSYGVQNTINKAYIASKGTTMPEGMKESFPRISPYVKQLDMDVKTELHDATEQMVLNDAPFSYHRSTRIVLLSLFVDELISLSIDLK